MACTLYTITLDDVCTLDIQNCDGINTSITFTPNEIGTPQDFAFCAISYDTENPCTQIYGVSEIGECTCNCYVIYSEEEATIKYVDCDNNIIEYTLINDGVYVPSLKVCAKGIIDAPGCKVVNFGDCNGAPCHIQDCQCYTIPAGYASDVYYLDCASGLLHVKPGVSAEPYSFCAQAIVGVDGDPLQQIYPCFNGECLTSASDILLYNLIKQSGPCPDICSGVTPVGGPAGTSTINIMTGYPVVAERRAIPTPPTPESSGTIVFNGQDPTTTGSYVAAPQPTLGTWLPGTGDFTVEWFQKMDLANSGSFPRVFSIGPDTTPTLGISIESDSAYVWHISPPAIVSGTIPVTYDGAWVHFAISYNSAIDGGNMSLFIAGTRVGNSTMLGLDITDAVQELYIGSDGLSANDGWAGNITNFRWTNSVVYPVGDSTITVPSAPLTALPDTKLLLLGGSISNPVSDSTGINTLNYSNITWSADTPF